MERVCCGGFESTWAKGKVTIRPGLTGTVPVLSTLSRCPERERSGRNNVPVSVNRPGRDTNFNFSGFLEATNKRLQLTSHF